MVLVKPLDREKHDHISLLLTAFDGGEPQMSGTMQIHISVLDANDNTPVCSQPVYKTSIAENSPKGTVLTTVSASDKDQGSNGRISFSIASTADKEAETFEIDADIGVVKLIGGIDYEKNKYYQIDVHARDGGGHTDSCKVIVDITDVNDNSPSINIISKSSQISEDSKSGTVIAILNIQDVDSNESGNVNCHLNGEVPFVIQSSSDGFYSLVTDNVLDRERDSQYNISVTCADEGVPSLSSSITLSLQISDVNDNAPVFEKSSYEASVQENNTPGLSIFTVSARDADFNQNARLSYILEDSSVNGVPVSSLVSVSADSGVIHAVRSFDYEQIKYFHFRVKAQDGGSPPLSSNVSVKLIIQDQNDNAPQVLYPVQSGGSVVAEIVPRSADVGYLVSKVVAVDVDSGQNAWLSYKLQKATDRALFEVGLQNGEIRTVRQVTDKDAVKQRLTIVVEDNGQPSRSATVNVNVALADSFPEVLSEFTDFTHDKEYNDNLTLYLILALAVVSFLFIVSIIAILSVKCYRWRRERMFYKSGANLPVIPYYPPLYADVGGTGTLQHVYNYDVCRTTNSRKSDLKFARPYSESIISLDTSGTQTFKRAQNDKLKNDDAFDEHLVLCVFVMAGALGQVRYTIPEEMTKGSLIGNIVQDLGLDVKRMKSGRARIFTEDSQNSPKGTDIMSVTATDKDKGSNAELTYSFSQTSGKDLELFSMNSESGHITVHGGLDYEKSKLFQLNVEATDRVNAESGEINAVRSFDYEQTKEFSVRVKAQDGGNPPLSSNVSVQIIIQDQNDNAPQVLYPVQSGSSVVAEIVPRSADVGYLVTKVVAVDVDSGQNAWLSYKLQKATDRALFEVGLQNGEIRTVRQVTDKDAVKQRLTVVVEDNGQPSRSATVNVNVALADSFPEVLSEFTDFTHDKEYNENLTFYLVLALAVVSFLFIVSIIAILSVKCYRWRRERMFYKSGANLPVIPYYPPVYADVGGTGTLQHVYNYDVCRTTDSRKSDLKYVRPCSESIISLDTSGTQTLTHAQRVKLVNDETLDQVRSDE
ncbi:Protocadherin gamma-A4 [Triplophysa tibetana]|uniref:Protocadherin gamma-A4 n=1 Tax=Triplophysa tibetana TaxID=1572043 RepID=A0A5A9NL74_9TELE|nr:Protocadherin gamma-A4 [Triplophysa tibetana]